MTKTTIVPNLKHFSSYLRDRESSLHSQINALNASELRADDAYEATLQRFNQEFLFQPVEFSDPKIVEIIHKQINVNPYLNPLGGKVSVEVAIVEYKFEGRHEIFRYVPDGMPYTMNDVVFQPDGYKNVVTVEVDTTMKDKNAILEEARRLMNPTFIAIKGNNEILFAWNQRIETQIKSRLEAMKSKYNKLLD